MRWRKNRLKNDAFAAEYGKESLIICKAEVALGCLGWVMNTLGERSSRIQSAKKILEIIRFIPRLFCWIIHKPGFFVGIILVMAFELYTLLVP